MSMRGASSRRTVLAAVFAGVILIGLVLATGGGFSTSTSPQSPPPPPPPKQSGTPTPMRGTVRLAVRHLTGHTYSFTYTVHNAGKLPVAGFQLNGQGANLFHVRGPSGWLAFGNGVCAGKYPGVLVYWSTGRGGIEPGKSGRFSFMVNTGGETTLPYSLSQGQSVLFGHTRGPQPSSLPASVRCTGQTSQ